MKLKLKKDRSELLVQELNIANSTAGCTEVIITIDECVDSSIVITIQPLVDPVKIVCTK